MEVRIRFFWDDLQIAVMESESDMEFRLAETPEVDAVVGALRQRDAGVRGPGARP